MTSISGVSSAWSHTYAQRSNAQPQPGRLSERLQNKFDQDQSGGIDATELEGLLSDVAQKTGASSTSSAADLLASNDANGDGSLSGDELDNTLQSVLPPPSTMEFAQSRGLSTEAASQEEGDDLFGKVDSNGDGAVSQEELQGLLEKMSGGTASQTSVSSDEVFSQLDTDSDGNLTPAEFDAGRPSGGQQQVAGDSPAAGMPPPPGGMPPPAPGANSTATDSTSYDELDTNEDGVVSAAERAVASLQESVQDTQEAASTLFSAIDTDGDNTISSSEGEAFIAQLNSQSNTSQTDADNTRGTQRNPLNEEVRQDLLQLAQLAQRQYAAVANNLSSTTTQGNTVNLLA
ncbi:MULTISPECIES: XopAW family type III secretion system calcium-binding effector [Giesbergeria]|uniref:XopAW family type III secretion system calcium-binding effector n=1 Tax=Giesbergeria sinuosa TaxID=80883 RepID=A0ABV9QBN8_9BURK